MFYLFPIFLGAKTATKRLLIPAELCQNSAQSPLGASREALVTPGQLGKNLLERWWFPEIGLNRAIDTRGSHIIYTIY